MVYYEEILRALQKHGVRYLILGGAAVNLHGVPRMTADLDITIDLSAGNVDALVSAMEETGLRPSLPVDPHGIADPGQRRVWREEKNLEALTFQSSGSEAPYREVDIVLEPPISFEEMYQEKLRLEVDDVAVDVVSLDHLIAIKRGLAREQDRADVESLEKIEESTKDD